MSFLFVNGIRVPVELGSARRKDNNDKTERSVAGSPLTTRFRVKESFAFKTVPLRKIEGELFGKLFKGEGEGADFTTDAFTVKGTSADGDGWVLDSLPTTPDRALNHGNYRMLRKRGSLGYHLRLQIQAAGTAYFTFRPIAEGDSGLIASFASGATTATSGAVVRYPLSFVSVDRNVVRLVVDDKGTNRREVFISTSHVRAKTNNRVAVSWERGGLVNIALNNQLGLSEKLLPGQSGPWLGDLAVGNFWYDDFDADNKYIGRKIDPAYDYPGYVGAWRIWPFYTPPGDLRKMSMSFPGEVQAPPYLRASGVFIGPDPLTCEARVVDATYLSADEVQLTIEMDEV